MAQVVDDKGNVRAPSSGSTGKNMMKAAVTGGLSQNQPSVKDFAKAAVTGVQQSMPEYFGSSGGGGGGSSYVPEVYIPPIVTSGGVQRPVAGSNVYTPDVNTSVSPEFVDVKSPSSMPPVGTAGSVGSEPAVQDNKSVDLISQLFPSYGADSSSNAMYEDLFRQKGMSEQDIQDINDRGSWLDIRLDNPQLRENAKGMIEGLQNGPFQGVTFDEIRNGFGNLGTMLSTQGSDMGFNPDRSNSTSIGDLHVIDDGKTFDYDHLTSNRATGAAMQDYVEKGMGGRNWWEYNPEEIYTKSDEQVNHGFTPYLPDDTARGNMAISDFMDRVTDLGNDIGRSRELLSDYRINFDRDKDASTTNDSYSLSGSDFDYRANPYIANMRRLMNFLPLQLLTKPEGGMLHGAPVSTMVQEHEFKDKDGNTRYLYGDLVDSGYDMNLTYADGSVVKVPSSEYNKWQTDEEGYMVPPAEYDGDIVDSTFDEDLHLFYSDGQDVYVPKDVYSQWQTDEDGTMWMPDSPYVRVEDARGFLPEDLDALNENARATGNFITAPVRYMPDLVMEDGTRLTWEDVNEINNDLLDSEGNSKNGMSYDFGPLSWAKPRRLMGDIIGGDLRFNPGGGISGGLNVNWGDMLGNAWDFTAGSIPISINQIAWPISIMNALSKSASGLDPNKHNSLTDSDMYISGEIPDPNQLDMYGNRIESDGTIKPTYTPINQLFNTVGNAIVPLTEMLAGPLSGSSLIESLAGKIPSNPTTRQVLQNFGLGMLGEGLEEIVGNLPEELTTQGTAAFGNPVSPEGERLLDDEGNPVLDEYGNYKFQDIYGNPMTYMTDETGHVYQDENTPWDQRLANFLDIPDLANAFAGGALVDAVMQAPTEILPSLFGRPTLRYGGGVQWDPGSVQRDRMRQQTGIPQYVDPEEVNREVEVDPEFIRMFGSKPATQEE